MNEMEESECEIKVSNKYIDIYYTYVYVVNIVIIIGIAIALVICLTGLLGFLICPLCKYKITKALAPRDKLS